MERTRNAAVAALVMLPPFTLLLAFDLSSAMRILFTVAIVLVSLSRRDVRETGVESMLSAAMAGVVALAFSLLYAFWPEPGAALLAMAFLGLLVVPYAFKGRHRGAVALAVPLVWVLLGVRRQRGVEDAGVVPLFGDRGVLCGLGAGAGPACAGLASAPWGSAPRKSRGDGRLLRADPVAMAGCVR